MDDSTASGAGVRKGSGSAGNPKDLPILKPPFPPKKEKD